MTFVLDRPADAEVAEVLITFDDFVRMDDEGFFPESRRLELIGGRIFSLSPVSLGHAETQAKVLFALHARLNEVLNALDARIVGNATIHIDELNAPEFDAAIVGPTGARFLEAADALLVVEVAVTSVTRDLKEKPALYASGGIQEYWVVNRRTRRLHIFRNPVGGEYWDRPKPLGPDETIAPLFAPDIAIPVTDLL